MLIAVCLPRQFEIEHQAEIHGSFDDAKRILFDIKHWPELMAWKKYNDDFELHISSPSNTLGANAFLQSLNTDIEISITRLTDNAIHYSLLVNNEHSMFGAFSIDKTPHSLQLNHVLKGTIHSTVSGGVTVLFIRSLADNMFRSSVNNLQSQLKLAQKDLK